VKSASVSPSNLCKAEIVSPICCTPALLKLTVEGFGEAGTVVGTVGFVLTGPTADGLLGDRFSRGEVERDPVDRDPVEGEEVDRGEVPWGEEVVEVPSDEVPWGEVPCDEETEEEEPEEEAELGFDAAALPQAPRIRPEVAMRRTFVIRLPPTQPPRQRALIVLLLVFGLKSCRARSTRPQLVCNRV